MPTALDALRRKLARLIREPGNVTTRVPGLSLHRRETTGDMENLIYRPTLILVVAGRKVTTLGVTAFSFGPGDCLVTGVPMPAVSRHLEASRTEPFLAVSVRLDRTLLADAAERLRIRPEEAPPDPEARSKAEEGAAQGLLRFRSDEGLRRAVERLVTLEDEPVLLEAVAPLVTTEILCRLLTGPAGALLSGLMRPASPPGRIADSIRVIRRDFREPIDIDALAEAAHMSRSTFFRQFRRVTNLSPVQYVKQLRLAEARRLMIDERLTASRASIEVGYESPNQFSRDYHRLFGRAPRADARSAATL